MILQRMQSESIRNAKTIRRYTTNEQRAVRKAQADNHAKGLPNVQQKRCYLLATAGRHYCDEKPIGKRAKTINYNIHLSRQFFEWFLFHLSYSLIRCFETDAQMFLVVYRLSLL